MVGEEEMKERRGNERCMEEEMWKELRKGEGKG